MTVGRPDPLTLCLCCGTEYPFGGECPQVGAANHSMERALEVAEVLILRGVSHPTSEQVRDVVKEIEA